ncbi:restriction endonuclease [Neorhizobium vignae]|uniref:restriction endonuclease n=1 Tax=Neorhizobium vignae TaxID=690585 RepID=UPI003D810A37
MPGEFSPNGDYCSGTDRCPSISSRKAGGITTKFAVQCKQSKNSISATPIRTLSEVLNKYRAYQGVLITTSHLPRRKY